MASSYFRHASSSNASFEGESESELTLSALSCKQEKSGMLQYPKAEGSLKYILSEEHPKFISIVYVGI